MFSYDLVLLNDCFYIIPDLTIVPHIIILVISYSFLL